MACFHLPWQLAGTLLEDILQGDHASVCRETVLPEQTNCENHPHLLLIVLWSDVPLLREPSHPAR